MRTDSPAPDSPVLVTGLAGNLGRRLALCMPEETLVGVDLFPPRIEHRRMQFHRMDLSKPGAVPRLADLIRSTGARRLIHLAFVLDPARTGALTRDRQREINILGSRHLLEAIEQVNRSQRQVEFVLYLSSVTSYGPFLPGPVQEDHPQNPHSYTYALHKKETDELFRLYHSRLNGCAVYIVRGHIFLGRGVENFIVGALRGQPGDRTRLGRWLRRRGWRLPLLLPVGDKYRGLFQFMHIDDAARLMAWLCRNFQEGKLEILNAQGRGHPVTAADCASMAGLALLRLPSYRLVDLLYRFSWWLGLSPVPGEALPYFAGSYVMDTTKLEQLLGAEYEQIVRHTTQEALQETVEETG